MRQVEALYSRFKDSLSDRVTLCLKHTNTRTHKKQPHIVIIIIIMIIIIIINKYLKLFKSNSLGRKFLSIYNFIYQARLL